MGRVTAVGCGACWARGPSAVPTMTETSWMSGGEIAGFREACLSVDDGTGRERAPCGMQGALVVVVGGRL